MPLTQPGTWKARTREASVYETDGGALMLAAVYECEDQTHITGYFCLASKAGEIQQKTLLSLREAYGWDGTDPFWLADTDLSANEVEIVVEMEADQQGQQRPRVRWINRPGGGTGRLPEQGNRAAILAKYGGKLRALAGGVPLKPTPPAAAAKPMAPPPPKPAPPPSAPAPAVKPATMNEAWDRFCQTAGQSFAAEKLAELWYKAIAELTSKTADACSDQDWGLVAAQGPDWLKEQIPL